jgi:uncharacterized protein
MKQMTNVAVSLCGLLLMLGHVACQAQEFFRIGTGGTAGTYYPVGVMVGNAVTVPGKIVATAQITTGSATNVKSIQNEQLESGFSQSDVATWAYTGTMAYQGKPPMKALRLIATLYPESLHIVVRQGSNIKRVADLKGKRVSLDEQASGTLVNARMVLKAFGLAETDVKAEYIKPDQAAEKLKSGQLDAFFYMGGAPAKPITALLAGGTPIELLNVQGDEANALLALNGYFSATTLEADTYKGLPATQTLAVSAQWLSSDKISEALVYQMTKTLFSDAVQQRLQATHPKGKFITAKNAVTAAGIPFHAGAAKYYREVGLLK